MKHHSTSVYCLLNNNEPIICCKTFHSKCGETVTIGTQTCPSTSNSGQDSCTSNITSLLPTKNKNAMQYHYHTIDSYLSPGQPSIVIRLQGGLSVVRILGEAGDFFLLHKSRLDMGLAQLLAQQVLGEFPPWIQQPGHEIDHSLSGTQWHVKERVELYLCAPLHAFMVRTDKTYIFSS